MVGETAVDNQGARIKTTKSRCGKCGTQVTAEVWLAQGKVYALKQCPVHGEEVVLWSNNARHYYHAEGNPENRCCVSAIGGACGTLGDNAIIAGGIYDRIASCISLIEIVDSCNITCPTCFAASPYGKHSEHLKAVSLEDIKRRVLSVVERKGEIEILQLSGGEPTIHPQLFELLEWLGKLDAVKYIFLNTNGLLFGSNDRFAREFERRHPRGKVLLYLQFDGLQEEGQLELRGADYRLARDRAIARAEAMGIPVILVSTVTRTTLPFVYETVRYALGRRHIRAAHFQPAFQSGRVPQEWQMLEDDPISVADVIESLKRGSKGFLTADDFTPLPCGDPNCHTIGAILRPPGADPVSVRHYVDFSQLQGFLRDRISYDITKLAQCGCDNDELGRLLKQFALEREDFCFVSIKPFMDRRTWDQDRIDRCCTHVIDRDNRLRPFCEYYANPQA